MQTTKKYTLGLFLVLITLFSCDDNGVLEISNTDQVSVADEAVTDSYFEDTDDLSMVAMASDDATMDGGRSSMGGRKILIGDLRLECADVEIVLSDDSQMAHPKGVITIDFGSGCEDKKGDVRRGKIIITFDGRRFLPGSSYVTTFENYSINDIKIEGARTVTNVNGSVEEHPSFTIVIEGGKATWPDGTFATRESNRNREWIRASNPVNDEWHVTGNAAGTNRKGVSYTMEITEALVYKRECAISNRIFMAVAGVKVLTTENRQKTIDYGDGNCDRTVTILINGVSKEMEVGQ
ncbi:MAG: hypothetical protein KF860_06420 [Cyclobacteriaceae bacterium]|nr:hypothetical protein [Cyclobacteriaceae bacterium]